MSVVRTILIGLVCVAAGTAADALFLPHQSIWSDEVTQMAGVEMGPVDSTKWLAGTLEYDVWAPKDRMPPLSYWAGWTWTKVFGFGEMPMRWFGVACISLASAIVFAAASKAWGTGSGAAAALLLGTSPNVIMLSVEIRPYPVLVLMSAGVFACLVGYASGSIESRRRWLAGIVACGIGAMYVHFFGLVALGGALVAAFVLAILRKEKIVPVIVAGVVAGIASPGLKPFITASYVLASGLPVVPVAPVGKVMALVGLVYRFFSHPSTSVSVVAVGLAGLGFGLGVACSFAPKRRSGLATLALLLSIASGLAVVTLVHLAQSSFLAAQLSYNLWVFPPLVMLIASGLAAEARAVRVTSLLGIVLVLSANTYAAGQLSIHGDFFAHTSYTPIARLLEGRDLAKIAVVHDDDGDVPRAYTISVPIRYGFDSKVHQYNYVSGGPDEAGVVLAEFPELKAKTELAGLPFDDLIIVRSMSMRSADIASQIRGGVAPLMGDGPVTKALLASGRWERVGESTHPSFYGVDLDVFRRIAHP